MAKLTPQEFAKRLRRIVSTVNKDGKMFVQMGTIATKERERHIYAGKDYDGKKFDPLKAKTVRAKERKGYKHPRRPLIATGDLYSKTKIEYKGGGRLIIKLDNKVSYHETATSNRPARKTAGFSKESRERVGAFFARNVKRIVVAVIGK